MIFSHGYVYMSTISTLNEVFCWKFLNLLNTYIGYI